MANPTELVEIAFATTPDDPSPTWVDVTQWVQVNSGISITRGRQNEHGEISASTCTLTLDNADGRFTPDRSASPYYPNVKKGRRLRVSVTDNAVTYRRFTGYIDEWAVSWPTARTNQAFVDITASSRLARLGRGAELRSMAGQEILEDAPVLYYPLGESEEEPGTGQAGNIATATQYPLTIRQVGSGGTLTFGTGAGSATDEMPAPTFTASSSGAGGITDGKHLWNGETAGLSSTADTHMIVECFFTLTSANDHEVLLDFPPAPGNGRFTVATAGFSPNRKIAWSYNGITAVGSTTIAANTRSHVAVKLVRSGTTITFSVWLDGVAETMDVTQVTSTSLYSMPYMGVGGPGGSTIESAADGRFLTGEVSHVAVFRGTSDLSGTRIIAHRNAGRTGFSGESSDARVDRFARYAGIPTAEVSTETGMSTGLKYQVTDDRIALSVMQDATATEGGLLFDARDGALTFHARSHRYTALSALTFGTKQIQPTLETKLDDEGLVNDVTVTQVRGTEERAFDQTSITEYGRYHETIETLTLFPYEVRDVADWTVYQGSSPRVRVPTLQVDLRRSTTAQAAAILAREISDRITLADLPPQAPTASLDFFIEGYTEQITDTRHALVFNLSPADRSAAWQLDSSTWSVLGTTTKLGW